jgi:hypothetical protein
MSGKRCIYYLTVVVLGALLARYFDVGLDYGGHPGVIFPAVIVLGLGYDWIWRDLKD